MFTEVWYKGDYYLINVLNYDIRVRHKEKEVDFYKPDYIRSSYTKRFENKDEFKDFIKQLLNYNK